MSDEKMKEIMYCEFCEKVVTVTGERYQPPSGEKAYLVFYCDECGSGIGKKSIEEQEGGPRRNKPKTKNSFIGRNKIKGNRSIKLHIFTKPTNNSDFVFPLCSSFICKESSLLKKSFEIETELEKIEGPISKDKICKHCLKELELKINMEKDILEDYTYVKNLLLSEQSEEKPINNKQAFYPLTFKYSKANLVQDGLIVYPPENLSVSATLCNKRLEPKSKIRKIKVIGFNKA